MPHIKNLIGGMRKIIVLHVEQFSDVILKPRLRFGRQRKHTTITVLSFVFTLAVLLAARLKRISQVKSSQFLFNLHRIFCTIS